MTERILVVEDSATQREVLRTLLEDAGYEVEVAVDGEAGVAAFDPDRFRLVISDIALPGEVDGYELCRRVKAGAGRHVPVMLLTSLTDPLDIINGLECGADNFLTKPYQPEHLLSRITLLLTTRQARREARLQVGVDVFLLGRKFNITSNREQILDLLISTFEDAVHQNRALRQREAQLERSHQSLEGLYCIALGLNESRTEAEVAAIALARALELPGVQAGWISLLDGESGFRLVAALGLPPALEDPHSMEGLCTCRRMLLEGELGSVVNVVTCERLLTATGDTRGIRYHAAIPLWVGGRTIGVMNLAGPEEGMFSDHDLRVLFGVGNQIAGALVRARMLAQLERRVEERTASLQTETEVRQRVEAQLDRAIEEQLAIMESIPDVLYLLDTEARLIRWNRRLEAMTGHTAEALDGRSALDIIAPRARESVAVAIATAIAGDYVEVEADLLTAEGGTIPYHFTWVPLRNDLGEVTRVTGAGRDLTRYKKLEQRFRQSQKLEAIGRLASGIAHDFNNVLTAISGYAELLLQDEGVSASQRADVGEIAAAAKRAGGLTGQLLAFSRQQVVSPRVLDLNAVVSGMERMLQRIVGDDVSLTTALGAGLGRVRADAGQLEQVILNLAVNARDAMPRGGFLTIETSNADLDSAYAREHAAVAPGPYVMLAVNDTGVGMDAETQGSIFEPFFTTKGPGEGTGLGLATVHGIVEQCGGNIWIYSEPGRGTTFKIYLPRVDELPTGPSVLPSAPAREEGTETLLLVEDNEAVRRLVRTVLRGRGYTVHEAAEPAAALRIVADLTDPVALLVTDVVMPGMNGRELAERLQAHWPGLLVLYTSGYTDDAIVKHGVLEGGVAFLGKPFTPAALLRKVREVLDRL